jgi:hypothetical protein
MQTLCRGDRSQSTAALEVGTSCAPRGDSLPVAAGGVPVSVDGESTVTNQRREPNEMNVGRRHTELHSGAMGSKQNEMPDMTRSQSASGETFPGPRQCPRPTLDPTMSALSCYGPYLLKTIPPGFLQSHAGRSDADPPAVQRCWQEIGLTRASRCSRGCQGARLVIVERSRDCARDDVRGSHAAHAWIRRGPPRQSFEHRMPIPPSRRHLGEALG